MDSSTNAADTGLSRWPDLVAARQAAQAIVVHPAVRTAIDPVRKRVVDELLKAGFVFESDVGVDGEMLGANVDSTSNIESVTWTRYFHDQETQLYLEVQVALMVSSQLDEFGHARVCLTLLRISGSTVPQRPEERNLLSRVILASPVIAMVERSDGASAPAQLRTHLLATMFNGSPELWQDEICSAIAQLGHVLAP